MLGWVNRFNIFLLLDDQNYHLGKYHNYDLLLAAGVREAVKSNSSLLQPLLSNNKWYFGHISFEFDAANTRSGKKNRLGFPEFFFFEPSVVCYINNDVLTIEADDPALVYDEIIGFSPKEYTSGPPVRIQSQLSREEYIDKINGIKEHIHRGDCYELNFCMEFFAESSHIIPERVFKDLMEVSPNPFSCYYRLNNSYLVCASPERFLLKKGNRLVSQPIKGTMKRDLTNDSADQELARALKESMKERSENVMVVDLVRNDLSRICKSGTVQVEELFGIYSFPQVHQMISTITGEINPGTDFPEILQAMFPMGSMTGAPKHRVLELINEFEPQQRGIFSGSVGYISPGGDFDLNVVIRSIMYNEEEKYLSYQVGSGITFYSDAASEWEECLLKAAAIKKVLAIS